MSLAAHVKGIVGAVVDGVLTDRVEIEDLHFPVFGRGISPLTTRAPGLTGELNVPVRCGGIIVNPGDIVLADDDGIVVLPPARIAEIVAVSCPASMLPRNVSNACARASPWAS